MDFRRTSYDALDDVQAKYHRVQRGVHTKKGSAHDGYGGSGGASSSRVVAPRKFGDQLATITIEHRRPHEWQTAKKLAVVKDLHHQATTKQYVQ